MTDSNRGGLDRRGFMQLAAADAGLARGFSAQVVGQPAETLAHITRQPSPSFAEDLNTADIVVETLIAWGATHAFGVVGDGINSIIEALRKRRDRIRYVGVRHEEAAAFMASGFAKHTGRLAVCVGTTGPVQSIQKVHRASGNEEYGCALAPIDFVAFARACGAEGFRCNRPEEVRPAIQAALSSPKAALVEAIVDADEKPAKPDELKI